MRLFPRRKKDRRIEDAIKYVENAMKSDWETIEDKKSLYHQV